MIKGELKGDGVVLGEDGLSLYEQGGYGRPGGDKLALSAEEALYLAARGRICVGCYSFEQLLGQFMEKSYFLRKFLVYRDIRERGFVIQAGPQDFRVFKRGQKPGTGSSYYLMRVLSERDLIEFSKVAEEVKSAHNMRKQFLLAVVDDEEEITYYEVKISSPMEGTAKPICSHITGNAYENAVIIPANPEDSEFEETMLGTKFDQERIMLSSVEALYLLKKGILELNGGMTYDEYYRRAEENDHELSQKTITYTNLRDLKNIPRTAYKFGHHFRVYSGKKQHSELLVHSLPENESMPMSVISRSVRLAHSVRKKMLFACVKKDNIEYIEFARIKL
ncbi:tRNA-intron endonuclease [Methanomicrobium sp. W14]|uniref:tRNA-intron lyase n=1 Tax=Methanomicrobium sp. W14 TaxID=2817839 RepID=UPI001AE268FF|nr:tRNA-intron lyase [Methanomicrobium sp. W14]MBP2134087.1 tRNA-intron endonuclease [Methanomicrobium sp. W14]